MAAALGGLGRQRTMVVADFLDLTVDDFEDLRAERLDHLPETLAGTVEERFGDAMAAVAGRHSQVAASVRKEREAGLVMPLHIFATFVTGAGAVDNCGMRMEAIHHAFEVVAIESVEVAHDQFFFERHKAPPRG